MTSHTSCCEGGHVKPHRTLTFRLLAVFSILMAVIIASFIFTSSSVIRNYLIQNLDDDLTSSLQILTPDALKRAAKVADAGLAPLSDYYLYVEFDPVAKFLGFDVSEPVERISSSTLEKYGIPDQPQELLHQVGTTFTTNGSTPSIQWRVLVTQLTSSDGTVICTILVGRPLTPLLTTVSNVTLGITMASILTALGGAVLAYFLIHSSLRPLRSIERTTHQIAEGDLSQRVPEGKPGSEAAHLANSINIMLEQIEHSFAIKEQSERQIRQFVSDASHELRTPLATVRGYAELYRIGGVPETHIPSTMERIESEAKRMTGLVEDLLQLARLDEGRPLNFQRISLTEIAFNVVQDYRVRSNNRPASVIGLDNNTAPKVTITGDHDKITQVITNLLSNVLMHTPEGTPVEIAIGTTEENTSVVEVRDHGPGVPSDVANRIFERFFRVDYSRSRASGGSGLGLAIVSSIMYAHHGKAEVLETEGGGLTIRLLFPSLSEKEQAHPQTSE